MKHLQNNLHQYFFSQKSGASRLKSHDSLPKQITNIHPWAKDHAFLQGINKENIKEVAASVSMFALMWILLFLS
jgi:hypothetical protein